MAGDQQLFDAVDGDTNGHVSGLCFLKWWPSPTSSVIVLIVSYDNSVPAGTGSLPPLHFHVCNTPDPKSGLHLFITQEPLSRSLCTRGIYQCSRLSHCVDHRVCPYGMVDSKKKY